jgi:hypothetical protein
MKKYLIVVGLLLGSLLLLASCRDTKDEPDQCALRGGPINAEFIIQEVSYVPTEDGENTKMWEVGDTVVTFWTLYFTPKQTFDEYYWQIGDDPRIQRTKEASVRFTEPYNNIRITLIGKRNSDPCRGGQPSYDTAVKVIQVRDRQVNPPLFGRYAGYFSDAPDKRVALEIGLHQFRPFDDTVRAFRFIEGYDCNLWETLSMTNMTFTFRDIRPNGGECVGTVWGGELNNTMVTLKRIIKHST